MSLSLHNNMDPPPHLAVGKQPLALINQFAGIGAWICWQPGGESKRKPRFLPIHAPIAQFVWATPSFGQKLKLEFGRDTGRQCWRRAIGFSQRLGKLCWNAHNHKRPIHCSQVMICPSAVEHTYVLASVRMFSSRKFDSLFMNELSKNYSFLTRKMN